MIPKKSGLALLALLAISLLLPGCALTHHIFSEPSNEWASRNGQLLYRNKKTTIIGEVLVRSSKSGGFELTFSKGPGVVLLTLRQDSSFAQIKGGLSRGSWSGPISSAPPPLRGWVELRDVLLKAQNQKEVKHVSGKETFLFHF